MHIRRKWPASEDSLRIAIEACDVNFEAAAASFPLVLENTAHVVKGHVEAENVNLAEILWRCLIWTALEATSCR
jgi:hypothetical protein